MMTHRISLPALVAAATLGAVALTGLARPAGAEVWIEMQEGGFTADQQHGTSSAGFTLNFIHHDYQVTSLAAQDQFDLNSSSFELAKTAANSKKLTITVSATDLTDPATLALFTSGFTKNGVITPGWKVDIATYLDPTNTKYNTTLGVVLLGSASFTSSGAFAANSALQLTPLDVPYTITTIYTITSPSKGSAAASAVVDASVPEPASLAALGAALVGFGVAGRRRKRMG